MTSGIPSSSRVGPAEMGLDKEAERVDQLAREVLHDNYLQFHIRRVRLDEAIDDGRVKIVVDVARADRGDPVVLEGDGVGLIDAFFDGMMRQYGTEYPSLRTISVSDFSLRSGFDGAKGRRSDALAVAELRVKNSEGAEFLFRHATPSVTRSSVRVALDALTFFINSERAYVQLHVALKDAKERRRPDLVQKYQSQMSTLVAATSYSEVIERLRKEGA